VKKKILDEIKKEMTISPPEIVDSDGSGFKIL
jgi:hypothetical protein